MNKFLSNRHQAQHCGQFRRPGKWQFWDTRGNSKTRAKAGLILIQRSTKIYLGGRQSGDPGGPCCGLSNL